MTAVTRLCEGSWAPGINVPRRKTEARWRRGRVASGLTGLAAGISLTYAQRFLCGTGAAYRWYGLLGLLLPLRSPIVLLVVS